MFLDLGLDMESDMAITLEEISTINAMGQTTVPKAVRQALGIDNGGRSEVAPRGREGADP